MSFHMTCVDVSVYLLHSFVIFFFGLSDLPTKWGKIPRDTDILVTHLPPRAVLDLAWAGKTDDMGECTICKKNHRNFSHWGCKELYKTVTKTVKPKVCDFIVAVCYHQHL